MPKHHEATASWWRQLVGASYVWWALALIAVAGLTAGRRAVSPQPTPESGPPAGPEPLAPEAVEHPALRSP
jgi:alpha-1,2-mannosyltransferase